jgi:hypothetical protein
VICGGIPESIMSQTESPPVHPEAKLPRYDENTQIITRMALCTISIETYFVNKAIPNSPSFHGKYPELTQTDIYLFQGKRIRNPLHIYFNTFSEIIQGSGIPN